tara:strand:- start:3081 stop:3281 length:201 start_codon:yes stop_codon:yes gene_type:complete
MLPTQIIGIDNSFWDRKFFVINEIKKKISDRGSNNIDQKDIFGESQNFGLLGILLNKSFNFFYTFI